MHFRKGLPLLVAALVGPAALALQANAPGPAGAAKAPGFEVATIKPNPRTDGAWRLQPTPDGYTGLDVSLRELVGEAYGIYDGRLLTGGPPWIDRERFDLEAKFDAAEVPDAKTLSFRQRADMLRALLEARFRLKVHRESKDFPVYHLVLGKSGPKLSETRPEDVYQGVSGANCLFRRSRPGYIQAQGCAPKDLEDLLRGASGRTVLDKTGMAGRYDFELRWAPENAAADSPEASAPSIFTALQEQLGLRLEPASAALSVLVIDAAERPSEN